MPANSFFFYLFRRIQKFNLGYNFIYHDMTSNAKSYHIIINDLIIYVVGFLTHAIHSFNIIYNKNRIRYLIHVLDD